MLWLSCAAALFIRAGDEWHVGRMRPSGVDASGRSSRRLRPGNLTSSTGQVGPSSGRRCQKQPATALSPKIDRTGAQKGSAQNTRCQSLAVASSAFGHSSNFHAPSASYAARATGPSGLKTQVRPMTSAPRPRDLICRLRLTCTGRHTSSRPRCGRLTAAFAKNRSLHRSSNSSVRSRLGTLRSLQVAVSLAIVLDRCPSRRRTRHCASRDRRDSRRRCRRFRRHPKAVRCCGGLDRSSAGIRRPAVAWQRPGHPPGGFLSPRARNGRSSCPKVR